VSARPFLARCALVSVALVGLPWAGSALGTAVTGATDTPAQVVGDCPPGAHLTCYEDGSGACYPNNPKLGVLDK
jgi:hypothetical protein